MRNASRESSVLTPSLDLSGRAHGLHVATMESGDSFFVWYQATSTTKDNTVAEVKGNWRFAGGGGKLKGIKGKGTLACTPAGDGLSCDVEGEYQLAKYSSEAQPLTECTRWRCQGHSTGTVCKVRLPPLGSTPAILAIQYRNFRYTKCNVPRNEASHRVVVSEVRTLDEGRASNRSRPTKPRNAALNFVRWAAGTRP